MESGLLAILDQLEDAISSENSKKASMMLQAFVNVVEGATRANQIDPIDSQLIIARARLIEELCL